MAHVSSLPASVAVPAAKAQLAAIARLRWRILVNSLRTMQGRLEIVSWIFMGLGFAALGLGGSFGLALGTWFIISRGHTEWLAALFWPIFMFWIFFPLIGTAFTEAFDSANLLRYPLRYSSFFLANLIYGSLDAGTVVGSLWLIGVAIGASFAAPSFSPWTLLTLVVFGAANVFLVRALFAWIERWLAQRRTREIMGILFFLVIIGFQMIGPIFGRLVRRHFQLPAYFTQVAFVQRFLPAGLAAQSISRGLLGDWPLAFGSLALLIGYALVFFLMFHLRLRAQYAGESFGEGVPREKMRAEKVPARSGWAVPGISGQVAAVLQKEARYLSRSGPMLFTFIMPAFVIFLIHFGAAANPARPGGLARTGLAFPLGAGYVLLLLTNLIYNCFGPDGAGMQFFFVAPVRMRDVLLAKNLAYMGVIALELLLVYGVASMLSNPPSAVAAAATLAAMLFAAPANFCVGNLMSLYSPKKYDYGVFGKQRAPGLTVLASFIVQGVTIGIAILTVILARGLGNLWIAVAVFAILAVMTIAAYRFVLGRIDEIALRKRESLISVLARTA